MQNDNETQNVIRVSCAVEIDVNVTRANARAISIGRIMEVIDLHTFSNDDILRVASQLYARDRAQSFLRIARENANEEFDHCDFEIVETDALHYTEVNE